jgi:hypothetical protein
MYHWIGLLFLSWLAGMKKKTETGLADDKSEYHSTHTNAGWPTFMLGTRLPKIM